MLFTLLKTKVINTCNNSVYEVDLMPRSAQQAECLIGRHPNCDLVLDGPAVSRVHGRVLFEKGECFFIDLGSTDGSRLNNEPTDVNQAYAIAPDDVIRIGEFALIVEALKPIEKPETNASAGSKWPQSKITARCVQIIQETHDVKTFRFVAEPAVLFDFKPGQFVCITLPICDSSGKPITRTYSISSSPSRPHTLDITVKRVGSAGDKLPPGVVSNWLHDVFEVGMALPMQGPFGSFNCVDCLSNSPQKRPNQRLLLISAGSGITPMMAIAQWLSDSGANIDITFIHAARSVSDIIFRQRLELLAAQHPNFKLAFTLTKNTPTVSWSGYRGRLNPALLSAICPDFAARTAFVCGPTGFMASTKDLLEAEGFPMVSYWEESFGSPVLSELDESERSGNLLPQTRQLEEETVVEFSASGKVISADELDTLLELAEKAGVKMASGCRMGSCGACKHQLVSGEVCYAVEPKGLSKTDHNSQYVLACVARPVGRVVVNL